jgi:hypothetical protein
MHHQQRWFSTALLDNELERVCPQPRTSSPPQPPPPPPQLAQFGGAVNHTAAAGSGIGLIIAGNDTSGEAGRARLQHAAPACALLPLSGELETRSASA